MTRSGQLPYALDSIRLRLLFYDLLRERNADAALTAEGQQWLARRTQGADALALQATEEHSETRIGEAEDVDDGQPAARSTSGMRRSA